CVRTVTVGVASDRGGESRWVREGDVVEHHLCDLKVECLPTDVPQSIEADISALGIGDSLRVADISPPPGATLLSEADEAIVSVVPPPILKIEEEVAEAVEGEEAVAEAEGATAEEAEQQAEGAPESGGEG